MKKIFALFVALVFVSSIFSLSSFARTYDISEKKELLAEATVKVKDYIDSAKNSIESSALVSESEKAIIIKKLDEKRVKIDKYFSQIKTINSQDQVNEMKSNLNEDIDDIKPLTEKPIIKIQKGKISNIVSKLRSISKKLGVVMPFLDEEEKSKIKELKDLIDSANKKLEKAEKLSGQKKNNLEEIKSLLEEAVKDIKQAFELVRELLSQIESDVLSDIETYDSETSNTKNTKTLSINKKVYDRCNYNMTWYDDNGSVTRKENFDIMEDKCEGYRTLSGDEISPSCYNKEECNDLTLKCHSVEELKKNCKTPYEESIENIYVNLNEAFKLGKGQSAKAIIEKKDGSTDSIIITLKQISNDGYNYVAGTNINYWINNDNIKSVYNQLLEGQKIKIKDYTIKILDAEKEFIRYIIGYQGEILNKKVVKQTIATGDTVNGVKLISVDVNGNSCVIKYDEIVSTINKGDRKIMDDGAIISITRVIPSAKQATPDYCNIVMEYYTNEEIYSTDRINNQY